MNLNNWFMNCIGFYSCPYIIQKITVDNKSSPIWLFSIVNQHIGNWVKTAIIKW